MGDQDLRERHSWQRAHDSIRDDFDLALDPYASRSGAAALNEFRVQRAGRLLEFDPTGYCSGCPALEYPHLKLGKNPGVPNWRREQQWQIADAFTIVGPDFFGEHTVQERHRCQPSSQVDFDQLTDHDGTFRFESDLPFDPLDARTYPSRYTRTDRRSVRPLSTTPIVALFVQDQWRARCAGLTLNLGAPVGLRAVIWRARRHRDNLAPRMAVASRPLADRAHVVPRQLWRLLRPGVSRDRPHGLAGSKRERESSL